MSGQKVDWAKTAVGVVKAGSAVVVDDKTMSAVVDMKTIEADLVIDAYNGRTDDVIKGILEFHTKLAELSFEVVEKKTAAKLTSIGSALGTAGYEAVKAYREWKEDGESVEGLEGSIKTLEMQTERMTVQIDCLSAEIDRCEGELAAKSRLAAVGASGRARPHV